MYKAFFSSFFLSTFSIVGISLIIRSIRYLETIFGQGAKIFDFIKLTAYLIPFLLFIILPISLAFTIYHTYKKFLHYKEIIALCSFGISKTLLSKPFLLFSLLIIALHYIISIYLLPISASKFRKLKLDIDQKSIINSLQFNTFMSKVNGLTLYIEKKDSDNLLKNIFIYNSKDSEKGGLAFVAESGRFYDTLSGIRLTLYNGSRLEFNHKDQQYSLMNFLEFSIYLNPIQSLTTQLEQDSYEFSISDLLFSDNIPQDKVHKFRTHGHFRILWPLTSMSIIISMLFFLIQYEHPRVEEMKSSIYAITSAIAVLGITLILYTLNRYVFIYLLDIILPMSLSLYLYNKELSMYKVCKHSKIHF